MRKKIVPIAALAITALVGGWALFRPELLFVNKTVNEAIPAQAQSATETISQGTFTSQAHETTGTAEIVKTGGKTYLRFKNFHTSNGPDVRVYLTTGGNPNPQSVSLGAIKGNIGDQFYEVPANAPLDELTAVSIWCERFAVGFGLAELNSKPQTQVQPTQHSGLSVTWQVAAFNDRTVVTSGPAKGDARFAGMATTIEENGKRFLELDLSKAKSGFQYRLFKQESLQKGAIPSGDSITLTAPKVQGKSMKSSTQISKEIDLWLYRSVGIIDPQTKRIVSTFWLRSSQETNRFLSLS